MKSSLHTNRLYMCTSETYEVRTLFFVFMVYLLSVCVFVKSFCKKKEFKTALITSFILLFKVRHFHCVKGVRVRSLSLRIPFKCGEIRTR